MAAIKLRVSVSELSNVMTLYDQIKVYRSTTGESGVYSEITGPGTRIDLVAGTISYEYIDDSGDSDYWYKFSYYNSSTTAESNQSSPIQPSAPSGLYCAIDDLRQEGFSETSFSDGWLLRKIQDASQAIELFTGRWFEPRSRTFTFDGDNRIALRFHVPIISITSVYADDEEVDLDDLAIYNRHVTEGLIDPDDRQLPRIELLQGYNVAAVKPLLVSVWPKGQRNIQVTGVFGYTDYDGSSTGKTPVLIKRLAALLSVYEIEQLSKPYDRLTFGQAWRINEITTRDQSIKLGNVASPIAAVSAKMLTGNPEIDRLLISYRRPSEMAVC